MSHLMAEQAHRSLLRRDSKYKGPEGMTCRIYGKAEGRWLGQRELREGLEVRREGSDGAGGTPVEVVVRAFSVL